MAGVEDSKPRPAVVVGSPNSDTDTKGSVDDAGPHVADDKNLDVAAAFLARVGDMSYSAQEEKALRWRVDKRLMPILFFNVILGAVDKTTISTGALYGLRTDCDMLSGDRYSWAGSSFYFGYLIWCLPSGSILQKLPMAKTMMGFELAWGVLIIASGFVNSFPAFLALRVLLGALEAPIVPGNFLMMGMWYTRREQPLRTGFFYTALASIVMGPLGYFVGFMHDTWFNQWRALFWIVGGCTIVYALVLGYVLPDSPVSSKFTTDKEKYMAITRLKEDQIGIENKLWKWEQFREAMLDPKTWIMVALNIFINVPNGALNNFSTLIIAGLGYSPRIASLLFSVVGLVGTFSSYFCNFGVFFSGKWLGPQDQVRGAFMIFGLIVGMIPTIFLYTLPLDASKQRLVALFMSYFYLGPYIVSVGVVAANTAGYTKKVTVNALIFMAYCVSNIVGPFFFKTEQAPLYPLGIAALLFSYGASILLTILYMVVCWRENGRRDRKRAAESSNDAPSAEATAFMDLTDKQNQNFRYVW